MQLRSNLAPRRENYIHLYGMAGWSPQFPISIFFYLYVSASGIFEINIYCIFEEIKYLIENVLHNKFLFVQYYGN